MLSMIRRGEGRVDFADLGMAEAEEVEKVKGKTRSQFTLQVFNRQL